MNIKRMIDNSGAEFYPETVIDAIPDLNCPIINVTEIDSGAGRALPANHVNAVVGNGRVIAPSDIPSGEITVDKMDKDSLLDLIYPVGAIYMTTTLSTVDEVADALGGTWEVWGSGRTPVGVDTSDTQFASPEDFGGKKVTHCSFPFTGINSSSFQASGNTYWFSVRSDIDAFLSENDQEAVDTSRTNRNVGGDIWNDGTGGIEVRWGYYKVTNLQPYITCYMYKRVA